MSSFIYRWSNHKGLIFFIFFITLAGSFYRGYGVTDNYYAISQWLVTYESGFIKRALLGTLFQLEAISNLTGYSVLILFFWASNFFLILLYLLVGLIMVRMVSLSHSAIFFIPYFLVGPLLRTQSVYIGYTDQVIMIMGILVVFCLIHKKNITVVALLSLGILVHEILFILVAPVIFYFLLIQIGSSIQRNNKIFAIKEALWILTIPIIFFAILIGFQELYPSKDRILLYLSDMLARQNPPHYRVDMISEIYTFTFMDWYAIHKDEAFNRLTAWGGPNGYISVILLVAALLHGIYFFSEKKINRKGIVWFASLFLIGSPLALHVLVVDHDRVWNIVTWVSFLSIWVFLEKFRSEFKTSGLLAALFFVLTFFAILFPQARSDVGWSTLIYIYIPILIWYLMWAISHLSVRDMASKDD
jgi:hypothetical protein